MVKKKKAIVKKGKLKKYHMEFQEIVYGYFEVHAKSAKEAKELILDGKEDCRYDNKSDFDLDEEAYEC